MNKSFDTQSDQSDLSIVFGEVDYDSDNKKHGLKSEKCRGSPDKGAFDLQNQLLLTDFECQSEANPGKTLPSLAVQKYAFIEEEVKGSTAAAHPSVQT